MGFDPATLATVTFCALIMFAILVAVTGMEDRQNSGRLWWVAAFLLTALGFALTMVAPGNVGLLRDVVNVVFLLAYGCGHAGARGRAGRRAIIPIVVGGGAIWAATTLTMTVSLSARMALGSMLICTYTLLAAREFGLRVNVKEPARRIAVWLCVAHAIFYATRLLVGPTFGFEAAYTASRMSLWGAALAFETMLFAAALSGLVITALREREALQARALALTDKLTGIGNRRAFDTQARALVDRVNGEGARVALLLMDIDGFKTVNDTHGHAAGDRLLLTVATMIRDCLPEPELFWRLGGDEFAILLCDRDSDRASDIAGEICGVIRESLPEAGLGARTPISVTIGIAFGHIDTRIEQLMEEADSALYAGKGAGRDQVVIAGTPPLPHMPAEIAEIRAWPVRPRLVHSDRLSRANSV
jgi:diguanylate cyclase (GGDEF)-like protein